MADNDTVERGFVEKNSRTRFIVSTTEWRNELYADVREYYLDDGDDWKPTKKGVRLSVELLPELQEILQEIVDSSEVKEKKEPAETKAAK